MWLVIENKIGGGLSVVSRKKRESLLDFYHQRKLVVPSRVLKELKTKKEADKYKADLKETNNLIKKIFIG